MASKHSNRERFVMKWLQKNYPGIRVFRFDSGQAYAKHTVIAALMVLIQGGTLQQAKSKLQVIVYGEDGFPDLLAIYYGVAVGIEIKVGKDRQRDSQKLVERMFEIAKGIYMICDDKSPLEDQFGILEKVEKFMTGVHNDE